MIPYLISMEMDDRAVCLHLDVPISIDHLNGWSNLPWASPTVPDSSQIAAIIPIDTVYHIPTYIPEKYLNY